MLYNSSLTLPTTNTNRPNLHFNTATCIPKNQRTKTIQKHRHYITIPGTIFHTSWIFFALFQLYETTCSQLSKTEQFLKQRLFTSLKKPLFQQDPSSRATTSGKISLFVVISTTNSFHLAQEFVKQRRKKAPLTQRRSPKQSTVYVCRLFVPT